MTCSIAAFYTHPSPVPKARSLLSVKDRRFLWLSTRLRRIKEILSLGGGYNKDRRGGIILSSAIILNQKSLTQTISLNTIIFIEYCCLLLVGGYMDIKKLCSKINLQPEVRNQVIAFLDDFNFSRVNTQLENFFIYEKMKEARTELQNILGEDKDNIKILACMLKASADAYEIYKAKDISDEIYYSTMKCYTRFINETYKITGKYYFDRYWWTTRQAGCHLFRIGELEYEIKPISNKTVIEIHIPSDADFSPFCC